MEIARLQIAVDASQVPKGTKSMAGLTAESKKTEAAVKSASSAVKQFVGALAIGATINKVIAATVEQERVTAQLEATLKSTGRYTPELSSRLQAMAGDLQQMTVFGDESVIAMQSLLLTFTQIGGKEFDRAQMAILDVATAMGTDLKSAALQVGKALNDPILGVTALARSGIQFSEGQKEVIKQLTETGRVAEAQGIILEELERQFGGSAEAARNTLGGALKSLQNAFGDLLEGDSGPSGVTDAINQLTKTLSDPQVKAAFGTIVKGVLDLTSAVAAALPKLFEFTRWAAEELGAAIGGPAGDDIVRLESKLAGLEKQASRIQALGKEQPQWLTDELGKYGFLLEEALKSQVKLSSAPDPVGTGVPATISAAATATEKLTKAQRDAVRAAEKVASAQKANEKVIIDLAEALYQATLPADELAKRQAKLSLNQYATQEQISSVQQLAGELQRLEDVKKQQETAKQNAQLLGQLDPIAGAQMGFQKELDDLRMLNEAKLLEDSRYLDLKGQAERAHAEQMRILQEENFRAQSAGNELLFASLDQLGAATTNVITGLITGANNGEEAIRALAGSILNEAVGAVVEMGIQYVKSAVMGQTAAAAGSAAAIALGVTTATALGTAYAAPAALASLASFGANSVPAAAGLTSTVALAKTMALASFEGGGFTGSGPRSGGMDGKGGFMAMVHPNETVIDHTKGQSAGGGVTINVIESKERAGTQQNTTNADGSESVDIFVADIAGDGPRSRAMQQAFGLQRQGR